LNWIELPRQRAGGNGSSSRESPLKTWGAEITAGKALTQTLGSPKQTAIAKMCFF